VIANKSPHNIYITTFTSQNLFTPQLGCFFASQGAANCQKGAARELLLDQLQCMKHGVVNLWGVWIVLTPSMTCSGDLPSSNIQYCIQAKHQCVLKWMN
jgi:hypothetical protein